MYTCRECEREINTASEICPYCGADLTLEPPADVAAPQKEPSLWKGLIRWGVVLGALCGFLWYILFLPQRGGDPTRRAEEQATQALREISRRLGAYADAQGGRFPQALDSLGESVRLPAQRAQSEGYQLQYQQSEMGAIYHYVLEARPRNYGYRSFYLDETGVLRATRENRPAKADDPPI